MEYKKYDEILKKYESLIKDSTPSELEKEQTYTEDKHKKGGDAYNLAIQYKNEIRINRIAPTEVYNFNNVLVGVDFEQLIRGMRSWGEDFDALPVHVTKAFVRTGDFVMAEKTIRPGQGMGKPLVERWDGKKYDQGFEGKEKENGIIMGVVQYSPIVPGWDTKGEKEAHIMTDVDIAISDKFIYVVCHGIIRSGALVEASSIKIKDVNGNDYVEHGVKEATDNKLVIGRAVSFGLPNPEAINVNTMSDRNLVLVRLHNVI